jgi:WS/DGAT/MGAT family acyltransferase
MEPLSGLDAAFLYLETPTQPMHITLCAVLEPPAAPGSTLGAYSFERARAQVAERLALMPPLTRRLVPVPLDLHHPLWEDVEVDLDAHVHRAALPAPGDDHALAGLTADLAARPLPRDRPLWEMWFVEGLREGRVAIIAKVHHATLDGIAGVEQLVTLFDLDADPVPPLPGAAVAGGATSTTTDSTGSRASGSDPSNPGPSGPGPSDPDRQDPAPGRAELAAWGAVTRLRATADLVPLVGRTVAGLRAVRQRRNQPEAVDGATPLTAPRTPFNGIVGGRRRVGLARLAMDDVAEVRKAVPGATVNHVVLATVSGALRRYLDERGTLPDAPLVAACPVNVRVPDEQGNLGNRFSAFFTSLPTHLTDPLERLEAAAASAEAARDEHRLAGDDLVQRWAQLADPTLVRWVARRYTDSALSEHHTPGINLMISNLAGPPMPLWFAGARLVRAYPMGPIVQGVGLNITVMSYCSSIDVGINAAADLVPDVDDLAGALEHALDELVRAARAR